MCNIGAQSILKYDTYKGGVQKLVVVNRFTAVAYCLFPANLTIAIHFTLASHKQISTNFNAFKIHWHVSLQILQNINTSHQHSKNYTGFLSNKESTTKPVFSQINNLHIFTIVFHSRHILFLHDLLIRLFFPFHICPIITWQKGFLCHRSTPLEFTPPWYPKLIFSTNIPFQTQNTPLQNCVPSLGSFPSPWTVYPDFDSCYSHFMPYRMAPSVRHRAIEVHYYYYYYCTHLVQCLTEESRFVWTSLANAKSLHACMTAVRFDHVHKICMYVVMI